MLLPLCVVAAAGCGGPDTAADGRLVTCLSPPNRAPLVDAGVTLRLVERASAPEKVKMDGTEVDLERWRGDRRADFDRACAALVAARGSGGAGGGGGDSGGPWLTSIMSLLAALVGAVGAGIVTGYLSNRGTRLEAAGELRRRALALADAADRYLRGRDGAAPLVDCRDLLDRRDDVDAQLRIIAVRYPSWTLLPTLRQRLRQPPLAGDLDEWLFPLPTRQERRQGLASHLAAVVDDLQRAAGAMERAAVPRHWIALHRPVRATGEPLPSGGTAR